MPFLAPIVGAITGAISAIGATAIGSFALKLAGSLLLSAASSALMGGAKTDETMQGRTVSVREPVAARRIIYGRARVGADPRHRGPRQGDQLGVLGVEVSHRRRPSAHREQPG